MARKFITTREYALFNSLNKEVIQNFSGQEVLYYSVSREETTPNFYGESIEKSTLPPVVLNARVHYDNPSVKSLGTGLDSEFSLEVFVLNDELRDRNLRPCEGDFVEYGQVFFEVTEVKEPQLVFGQVNFKLMTQLSCVPARESQFAAGNYSEYDAEDNSHPVQSPRPRNVDGT